MEKTEIAVSVCKTKVWVNTTPGVCVARFSAFSGYDVTDGNGHILVYGVGQMTTKDYDNFKAAVNEHHGIVVDTALVF